LLVCGGAVCLLHSKDLLENLILTVAKATTAYLPIAKARGFRSFFGEIR
jgi:hypothetical protein